MNIIRRTLDIDADTDARLHEMADERGQDVAAVRRAAGRREDLGGKLGFGERTAAPRAAAEVMIRLQQRFVEVRHDVE